MVVALHAFLRSVGSFADKEPKMLMPCHCQTEALEVLCQRLVKAELLEDIDAMEKGELDMDEDLQFLHSHACNLEGFGKPMERTARTAFSAML